VTRLESPGDPQRTIPLPRSSRQWRARRLDLRSGWKPSAGSQIRYKLASFKRLNARAVDLYATAAPIVLAGDYNVVPTNLDIYPTKSCVVTPRSNSRAAPRISALSLGWTDAIRALLRKRWERDDGLRLDHILLSSALAERLQDAGVNH
jgi:exodeoxyribonuclease III